MLSALLVYKTISKSNQVELPDSKGRLVKLGFNVKLHQGNVTSKNHKEKTHSSRQNINCNQQKKQELRRQAKQKQL